MNNKKGIALILVLSIMLVVVVLANITMAVINSQNRLTHHQISRIRAYYATQAAMNYTLEMLRTNTWSPDVAGGADRYACLNGCIDPIAPNYVIPADADIPYSVQVTIHPYGNPTANTATLDIRTNYIYIP